MSFNEEWFGEASQTALADLARKTLHLDGRVIEIGSWEGRSTVALANAVHPEIVDAVDTWQGSPGEVSAELAAEPGRDVLATFKANVAALTKGNVEPYVCDWRDYVAQRDDPIKFCFIDAEHTYQEVHDTIEAVLPHLVAGGVICGDDVHHPPVREAVLDLLPSAQAVATLWLWTKPADLAALYEQARTTPTDIYLHLPRFVQLVEELNAEHVIELGTRNGVSTTAFLYALEKTGGRLTSVDIDPRPDLGEFDHWTFVQSDDLDPNLLALLEPADIVFLDTSHYFEATLAELNVYRHLVKPGGVIVCHDTELPIPEGAPPSDPHYPVKRAIEEFVRAEGLTWENDPKCWGLGVIQLP